VNIKALMLIVYGWSLYQWTEQETRFRIGSPFAAREPETAEGHRRAGGLANKLPLASLRLRTMSQRSGQMPGQNAPRSSRPRGVNFRSRL